MEIKSTKHWNSFVSHCTFNPTVTCNTNLADCFRIFTQGDTTTTPAERQPPARGITLDLAPITVYTDGSCTENGKANALCGAGIWFAKNSIKNESIKIEGENLTNQVGKLAAIIKALEIVPNYTPLTIKTDSKYAIEGLTSHLEKWEDIGWIGIKNKDWIKRAAYLLRKRTAPTYFQWVKGHNGDEGNEGSDELAKAGANKNGNDIINLDIPIYFDTQGTRLTALTQAIAYKGIRETKPKHERNTTNRNLEIIKANILELTGHLERNETIWNSIRSRAIRPKISQFLFKTIHGAYKIGRFWSNTENPERAICQTCGEDESMNHILTECRHPARTLVWNRARRLWPHGDDTWPPINIGTTIGCGTLTVKTPNPRQGEEPTHNEGATRLLRILISEATYLIWTLRCERTIQGQLKSREETEKAWIKTINDRLNMDKIAATKIIRKPEHTNLVV
jgi:ribonuclease HI